MTCQHLFEDCILLNDDARKVVICPLREIFCMRLAWRALMIVVS